MNKASKKEKILIKLQARIRGYLLRKRLRLLEDFFLTTSCTVADVFENARKRASMASFMVPSL